MWHAQIIGATVIKSYFDVLQNMLNLGTDELGPMNLLGTFLSKLVEICRALTEQGRCYILQLNTLPFSQLLCFYLEHQISKGEITLKKNSSQYLSRICSMLSTVLSGFLNFMSFSPHDNTVKLVSFQLHFIDEKIEAQN